MDYVIERNPFSIPAICIYSKAYLILTDRSVINKYEPKDNQQKRGN